ncbi:of cenp-0 superfamily [Blumeria hordei DH14]|uniref:Of cenp-0 superfamily n=1 Tax=Blumeria graminis f. sp. hordei (strain DH14) TaxID=546991 RepID=N1JIA5_BLUG1|nr:of cenp-0 superfamily [Blumeria hordei DH14]
MPTSCLELQLDGEIESLQSQISILKAKRSLYVSTILSCPHTRLALTSFHAQKESVAALDVAPLISAAEAQHNHNQSNLYRLCATITTFEIQDPDPYASDNGRLLALRFDVSNRGKYVRPYYVMLNQARNGEEKLLRIHRHTLPPAIPITSLFRRYISQDTDALVNSAQLKYSAPGKSLLLFSRALRRAIIAYHNRLLAIETLRTEFTPSKSGNLKETIRPHILKDITATNAEATQLYIEWMDGRIGLVLIDESGVVKKCAVKGEDGRDREAENRATCGRIEGLGQRLKG